MRIIILIGNALNEVSESPKQYLCIVRLADPKEAGYPLIFGSDSGSGCPKISDYPTTLV